MSKKHTPSPKKLAAIDKLVEVMGREEVKRLMEVKKQQDGVKRYGWAAKLAANDNSAGLPRTDRTGDAGLKRAA